MASQVLLTVFNKLAWEIPCKHSIVPPMQRIFHIRLSETEERANYEVRGEQTEELKVVIVFVVILYLLFLSLLLFLLLCGM